MPNRILRESWLTSPSIDALSVEAERFFVRLLLIVDDWGRFEANHRVLLSRCFPLKNGSQQLESIARWLRELLDAGMVRLYRVDGREFGLIPSWSKYNHLRAKRSKYPDPPPASTCEHMFAVADTCEQMSADARTCSQMSTYTDSDSESDADADADAEVKNSSEPLADSRSKPLQGAAEPALVVFPCVGKGPPSWLLTGTLTAELQAAYPGLDVLAEARKAVAWLKCNPTKRKTHRGMGKFFNGWLSRAQDNHPRGPGEGAKAEPKGFQGIRDWFMEAQATEARAEEVPCGDEG